MVTHLGKGPSEGKIISCNYVFIIANVFHQIVFIPVILFFIPGVHVSTTVPGEILTLQFTLDKLSTQAIVYGKLVAYFTGEYRFKQFFFQVHNSGSYSVLDVS